MAKHDGEATDSALDQTPAPASAQPQAEASAEDRLIATYFRPIATHPGAFDLTDDAAAIAPPPGCDLVLKTDGVISGVHFFLEDTADAVARKALRINLSDLAAKGAALEARCRHAESSARALSAAAAAHCHRRIVASPRQRRHGRIRWLGGRSRQAVPGVGHRRRYRGRERAAVTGGAPGGCGGAGVTRNGSDRRRRLRGHRGGRARATRGLLARGRRGGRGGGADWHRRGGGGGGAFSC